MSHPRTQLWNSINEYVRSCGGDPSKRRFSEWRQRCVVDVESAVDDLIAGTQQKPLPSREPLVTPEEAKRIGLEVREDFEASERKVEEMGRRLDALARSRSAWQK